MQIKIGNRNYRVYYDDHDNLLEDGPEETHGCIDYTRSKIFIHSNIAEDYAKEILLHEVLHGILDDAHIDKIVKNDDDIENFIAALSPRLMQVLNDNPDLLSYLTSEKD